MWNLKKTQHGRLNDFKKNRYALIDSLRGLSLISMIGYHACWNMVYLYGYPWNWYQGKGAGIWQQSICWTFILLSGFCWSMGKRQVKNGLLVFCSGLLVSGVTLFLMPQNRVVCGVLTCIGSCILLLIPLNRVLQRIPAIVGLVGSFVLFCLTRGINDGWLGIGSWRVFELPEVWYRQDNGLGIFAAWLGVTPKGFYSTDYFSLVPWIFLFLTGYFFFHFCKKRNYLSAKLFRMKIPVAESMGKHSLLIYLAHQPILYLIGNLFLL